MGSKAGEVEVVTIDATRLDDFDALQRTQPDSTGCWCMWFISRVADYHARGADGNRAEFVALLDASDTPMGLLAYEGDLTVGWCAVGPRRRYERAVKVPTMKGRDPAEDDDVWFVPCFLVHPDARHSGVATRLLEAAVSLAEQHGAKAVEGFPLSGDRPRAKSGDLMTGTEALFAACGFEPIRRPSDNRIIMRLDL